MIDVQSVIVLGYLTGRACGRGEIIGADVVVGLETDLKERLEFWNFAILSQLIIILFVHKHLI